MTKKIAITLAAAGILASSAAYAGAKWVYPVSVSKNADSSGSFVGTLGSTRNSADTSNYLGCYYENFTAAYGSRQYASCAAYDGKTFASCGTGDPALTNTIEHLQGDEYLWVQFDANGNCTRCQSARSPGPRRSSPEQDAHPRRPP